MCRSLFFGGGFFCVVFVLGLYVCLHLFCIVFLVVCLESKARVYCFLFESVKITNHNHFAWLVSIVIIAKTQHSNMSAGLTCSNKSRGPNRAK